MLAEQSLKEGDLSAALSELQEAVRDDPSDGERRIFLFQLLCVLGQWDRALTQLNVAADLDSANLLMAAVYRPALQCEAFREQVFLGQRTPIVFGEPPPWIGWLINANQRLAEGRYDQAQGLFEQAFDEAEPASGVIDGQPFEWIGDADSRLGPILEAIVDGRYFWIPFSAIREIVIEPPTELRDVVWVRANFKWTNGGESAGFVPSRYPHSSQAQDSRIAMARTTVWEERASGFHVGFGQRMLVSDANEFPLLEIRRIVLGNGTESGAETADNHG